MTLTFKCKNCGKVWTEETEGSCQQEAIELEYCVWCIKDELEELEDLKEKLEPPTLVEGIVLLSLLGCVGYTLFSLIKWIVS